MPTLTPKAGAIGLLEGQKEAGKRVDFKPDDYVLLVETKGYRLAWSRAAFCPCKPINLQTDQSDPTCTLCEGSGWLRFRPEEAVINSAVIGELDELQQSIVDDNAAVVSGTASSSAGPGAISISSRAGIERSVCRACNGTNDGAYGVSTQLRVGDPVPESERNRDAVTETTVLAD